MTLSLDTAYRSFGGEVEASSTPTICRLSDSRRHQLSAIALGGHRKPVLDPHRAFIVERITQTPHLTLHGLKAELAARGVKASHNAVWLFLRREGLRFKKNTVRP